MTAELHVEVLGEGKGEGKSEGERESDYAKARPDDWSVEASSDKSDKRKGENPGV